jgi:hypothetical protein
MKFLIKFILPFVKSFILDELTKESNKVIVINKLNELIDLPNLSESEELEVMDKVYGALSVLVKAHLQIKSEEE